MPRLILVNGAPGSGKSTLARRYGEDHPLTLVLDVDLVRGMLGGWLDEPAAAGVSARALAVAMARAHLATGHDVVVPQYLGRLEFVETLDRLAVEVGVAFIEVALISDRDDVVARFEHRSATSVDPIHQQAARLQLRNGGRTGLANTHDKLLAVVAARPATHVVITVDGDIGGTYARLLDFLNNRTASPPRASSSSLDSSTGTP